MSSFQFLHSIPADSDVTPAEVGRIIDNNLTDQFHRLRGLPGFQLDPLSWERVKELAAEHTAESLGKLGRTPADLVIYADFKRRTLTEWASMGDYMRWVLFKWPTQSQPDGRKACSRPSSLPQRLTVWRENDFPYNLEAGMEHHNLWCTESLSDADILQEILLKRQGYEYLYFRNPPSLASIPAVWHIHVISRLQMQ